jgi:hypothetical protein
MHPISRVVMLPSHFISGKPTVSDWVHLLEIGSFPEDFPFFCFLKGNE